MQIMGRGSVIFLDIDGVLMQDAHYDDPAKARENWDNLCTLFPNVQNFGYTPVQLRTAASRLLCQNAVACLHRLIERVSEVAQVHIVLSSDWRKGIDARDLKEQVFAQYSFGKRIIDKTAENSFSRGPQIAHWLSENALRYNIASYVVFDDHDLDLSIPHGDRFVKVNMLDDDAVNKAYRIMTEFTYRPEQPPKSSFVAGMVVQPYRMSFARFCNERTRILAG